MAPPLGRSPLRFQLHSAFLPQNNPQKTDSKALGRSSPIQAQHYILLVRRRSRKRMLPVGERRDLLKAIVVSTVNNEFKET